MILFSIQTTLSNSVVWMASLRPPISNTSSTLSNSTGTIQSKPIAIDITVYFMFHDFFQFFRKIPELGFIFVFVDFHSEVHWDSKVHYLADYSSFFYLSLYLVFWLELGHLFCTIPRGSPPPPFRYCTLFALFYSKIELKFYLKYLQELLYIILHLSNI